MSNYRLNPSDDLGQPDGTAFVNDEVVIDGGTAKAIGALSIGGFEDVMTARLGWGNVNRVFGAQVVQRSDVFGAFQTAGVTLTSVADDGSGFCDFTLAGHGLSVGQVFSVSGATAASLNTVHVITGTPDANSIVTNIAYEASATAGDYALVDRNFATQVAGNYLIRRLYGVSVAGTAYDGLRSGGTNRPGIRRSIHKTEHGRTIKTTTAIRAGYWNIYSGTWSTAPVSADDSIGNVAGGTVTDGTADHAALPTQAIPGELVYKEPQPVPVQDDYKAKTLW